MQITCDVLVIGAGPAGSMAAKTCAGKGVSVILIEKRNQVGVPVQCAEYVPWQITQEVKLPEAVIAQRIISMRTYMPDGEVVETQSRGFIIHRALFDQYLVTEAVEAGTKVCLQTRATGYENGMVIAKDESQTLQIKAKIIIGADGPHSTVGKWMGSQNTEFVHTAQYQMPLCNGLYSTEVYFRRDIPGGYGWVFPKGETANVGVGVDLQFGVGPAETLNNFVEYLRKERVIEGEQMGVTGGAIPVNGLLPKLWKQNMLLVGDAAGMAHPITGAGVSNAVLCGQIAGEIAGNAVLENNLDILSEYEKECRMLLGDSLMRARKKRELMESRWNGDDLMETIRSSWIGFEE